MSRKTEITRARRKPSIPEHKLDLFVEFYLWHGNGARAAREVGWHQTPAASAVTASRLLTRDAVREKLARRSAELLASVRAGGPPPSLAGARS